ncbi:MULTISPECIES: NADPH:quinone reductase [unclassified Burkholderia]|uniref:NADPH:quinone reductase n=1 Tax=unclassified Burkholderia TaxID=2613784 RepID=UPI001E56B011|nr:MULTISPECIES: NADPH:quinone reductase [unclassified Burkholderia]UEP31214.1 NADPH:quinone reductase [Burkholderia sp. B21-007]UEP43510.1 NADPH:quinone reductase [Burkholderia sp. B21-005]
MMQAVWYERVGAARDVLVTGDRPTPSPGPGEVLVQLYASGVNPSDVKARAGVRAGKSELPFPFVIPHSDGAGIVVESGPGSNRFPPRSRVWVSNGQWRRAMGTAAQYIAIDEQLVFPLPENTSYLTGAALGIPALTACHATLAFGDLTGRPVLISGGAGTVGRLAVQFAKQAGAFVVASGHGPIEQQRIESAGADAFIDYTSPTFVADVLAATNGRRIDHAVEVEFGANAEYLGDLLSERATVVTYGSARVMRPAMPFYKFLFKGIQLQFVLVYLLTPKERADAAAHINRLLEQGKLDVPIHSALPLRECARAHEIVENEQRLGAVLLSMQDPA